MPRLRRKPVLLVEIKRGADKTWPDAIGAMINQHVFLLSLGRKIRLIR
jgi:hypothetical protein